MKQTKANVTFYFPGKVEIEKYMKAEGCVEEKAKEIAYNDYVSLLELALKCLSDDDCDKIVIQSASYRGQLIAKEPERMRNFTLSHFANGKISHRDAFGYSNGWFYLKWNFNHGRVDTWIRPIKNPEEGKDANFDKVIEEAIEANDFALLRNAVGFKYTRVLYEDDPVVKPILATDA